MRTKEIKFRGLRTDGKGWAIGVPFYVKEERKCFIIDNCQSGTLSQHDTSFQGKEVHYKSVGQYIGLKDKNGVEIYEGDVLKGDWGNIAVIYDDRLACYRLLASNDLSYWVQKSNANPFEVIGNIHEKGGING